MRTLPRKIARRLHVLLRQVAVLDVPYDDLGRGRDEDTKYPQGRRSRPRDGSQRDELGHAHVRQRGLLCWQRRRADAGK
jgi:hypothetical protein